jgi:hypothetical protein
MFDLNFKDFLDLNESGIRFVSYDSYGNVTVDINGKRYMYQGEAGYIQRVWQKARFKPGSALNDLKKYAKLVDKSTVRG